MPFFMHYNFLCDISTLQLLIAKLYLPASYDVGPTIHVLENIGRQHASLLCPSVDTFSFCPSFLYLIFILNFFKVVRMS